MRRAPTSRRLRSIAAGAVFLTAAWVGAGAPAAPAQLPDPPPLPVPTPTLPAPTLPAPTLPAPLPPAPTTTTPSLPAPLPEAPSTAPTTSAVTTTVAGSTPSVSPAGSAGSDASPPGAFWVTPGAPAGSARPDPSSSPGKALSARPRATVTRFRTGGATTIVYRLTVRAPVEFVVRAIPSCEIVARFTRQGRPGLNRVRFTGVIGEQRLVPGVYTITPVALVSPRPRTLGRVGVEILPAGPPLGVAARSAPLRTRCAPGPPADTQDGAFASFGATAADGGGTPRAALANGAEPPAGGVAGAEEEAAVDETEDFALPAVLPFAEDSAGAVSPGFALALLAAAAGGLLLLGLLVVRFLRGTWDP